MDTARGLEAMHAALRADPGPVPAPLAIAMLAAFSGIGLWLAIAPERAWRLRHLLSFKNPKDVEPSDIVLAYYRISGIVLLGSMIFLGIRHFQS